MNESERIARAHRAKLAFEEFFEPMLDELRNAYSERLVEVANTELNSRKRADKITALSHALKVVNTLEGGMKALISDGEVAQADKIRADRIEGMAPSQRRLLNIAPY